MTPTTPGALPHPDDAAAEYLEVRLEPHLEKRPVGPVRRAARALYVIVLGTIEGGLGSGGPSVVDLVVTRIDTGAEVIRRGAGSLLDGDGLLSQARLDLETRTVAEFVEEWGGPVDS